MSGRRVAACLDVGSTYTKLAVVDLDDGNLLHTAEHRSTVDSDVLHGVDALLGHAAQVLPGIDLSTVYACSSAGGGLRLAVVGYERLVSAEAAHRVALTAGARVVHVAAGRLDTAAVAALRADRPDVVLLVGGTDGGDAEVLRHNAARLAGARLPAAVVVAGNTDARDEVVALLRATGRSVTATGNVLPRIGVLDPEPARAAIREAFLRHVIGGKRLSRGGRFAGLVRGATPDLVFDAVALLAGEVGGDLAVVDVGGATTDVYTALAPSPDPADPAGGVEVAGTLWHARTVEGDLGVRCSATGVLDAADGEGLAADGLADPARRRAADPGLLDANEDADLRLAALAVRIAVRRHARGAAVAAGVRRGGRDLRRVTLVVGSGGVLRYAEPSRAIDLLTTALDDHAGGWRPPVRPRVIVDRRYVLAPAGLLAAAHPHAAIALLRRQLYPG